MVRRRDIMGLAAVNVLIAISGVIATTQIAWVYGANRMMDGWFIAASLTSGILSLVQTGQLSELFLPEYIRIKHSNGKQKAFEAYCVVLNWAIASASAIAVLGLLGSRLVIDYAASGFVPKDRDGVLDIFRALLPLVPLQVAGAVQQMLGNAEKKYGRFEVGTAAGSFAGILSVACLHKSLGIWALVAAQWAQQLTTLAYRQIQLHDEGLSYRWAWKTDHFGIWQLFRQFGQTSAYVVSTQLYSVTLRSLLGALPGGVLSAYAYAETLYLRSSSLFLRPVGTVFFTSISTSLVTAPAEVIANVRTALSRYLEMYFLVLAVALPAARHLLQALWGGPRYGPELIAITHAILLLFLAALVFLMHGTMTRKMNLALGLGERQYFFTTIMQLAFVMVSTLMVGWFGVWGAAGTVALNAVGACTIGQLVVRKARPELALGFNASEFLGHAAALAPAISTGYGMSYLLWVQIADEGFGGWRLKCLHGIVAAMSAATSLILYKLAHRKMRTAILAN